MKLLIAIILAAVSFKSMAQTETLYGKVKSIKDNLIFTSDSIRRILFKNREFSHGEFAFDRESIFWDFDSDLYPIGAFSKEYDYNEKTQVLREVWNQSYITNYIYDRAGNLSQEKTSQADRSFDITNYHYEFYNSLNRYLLTSEINYGSIPRHFSMKQYSYDDSMHLSEERKFSDDGYNSIKRYLYNWLGHVIRETDLSEYKGKETERGVNYTFYNRDSTISEVENNCVPYLIKGACEHYFIRYDNKKRKSVVLYDYMGAPFSRKEYSYNDDNTIKQILWFNIKDSISGNYVQYEYNIEKLLTKVFLKTFDKTSSIQFKYKFDLHNNWTEQVKIEEGKELYVRKREITYWE